MSSQKPGPGEAMPLARSLPPSPQTPHPPLSDSLSVDYYPLSPNNNSRQTDRQTGPGSDSQCEIVDGRLCAVHRPGHVETYTHVAHLSSWMSDRGVRNAGDFLRRYGLPAVQAVAQEVDEWEEAGSDWKAEVRRPGALIHWMVKERGRETRPAD